MLVACGSPSEGGPAADGSTSSGSDGTADPSGPSSAGTSGGATTAPGTTEQTSGDTGSESGSEGGGSFISDDTTAVCGGLPDGVLGSCKCSFLDQDCGDGSACKPWANDGGSEWNAARCRPLAPDAGQRGEPCTVEVVASSGLDTCDVGLVCLGTQGDLLEGECVSLCTDESEGVSCEDPGETCGFYNQSYVPLCLPSCNPLEPSCDEGAGCYPGGQDDFVCLQEGERLEIGGLFHPECPSGTFWALEEQVPGCGFEEPCCTTFCDTSEASPCGVDVSCIPFFETPSRDFANLGYCRPDGL